MKNKETLEEAAENNYPVGDVWTEEQAVIRKLAFMKGAKWKAERMYSEEEVKALFKQYQNAFPLHRGIQVLDSEFTEWFNQFKKK